MEAVKRRVQVDPAEAGLDLLPVFVAGIVAADEHAHRSSRGQKGRSDGGKVGREEWPKAKARGGVGDSLFTDALMAHEVAQAPLSS